MGCAGRPLEPNPPGSSGAAAPRFRVEQEGSESPWLGRRWDKASLAQIALGKESQRAPEPAVGGSCLMEPGANWGQRAEQGRA